VVWLLSRGFGAGLSAYREGMAVAEDERAHRVVADVSRAAELAEQRLGGMGDRWRHTQAVAARARSASPAAAPDDHDLLVAAAWLHDVGYADSVARTGLHPLDGAEYLTRLGFAPRLVALVAHHSCARFEAAERGLTEPLATYVRERGPVADALIYADMTTGPSGETVTVADRIAEILERYLPEHPVHRAIARARGELVASVHRTQPRLGTVDHPM
jgi:putative nucleotidyltransferase with HDIG domain